MWKTSEHGDTIKSYIVKNIYRWNFETLNTGNLSGWSNIFNNWKKKFLQTFILLGLPYSLNVFSTWSTTYLATCSGVWFGTNRIENFPITFLGITVFWPGSLKAPSMPCKERVGWRHLYAQWWNMFNIISPLQIWKYKQHNYILHRENNELKCHNCTEQSQIEQRNIVPLA